MITKNTHQFLSLLFAAAALLVQEVSAADAEVLPGTVALTYGGDLASNMVAGMDRFLSRQLDDAILQRAKYWKQAPASQDADEKVMSSHRQKLLAILGMQESRRAFDDLELIATTKNDAVIGKGPNYEILVVRWRVFRDVHGEGLLLRPTKQPAKAYVVAIPDCEQTPEQLCGLTEGIPTASQFARRLADSGCQVIAPALISRNFGPHKGKARMSAREFLYRPAFEMGRQLVGYEVQKVLAAVDWFSKNGGDKIPIGIIGYGEGGMLALYSAALDTRIKATCVSGYFNSRQKLWREPMDHNLFGFLERFGDAELATMIAPRTCIVEAAKGPEKLFSGEGGGAPARLESPGLEDVKNEFFRAQNLSDRAQKQETLKLVVSGNGQGGFGSEVALSQFFEGFDAGLKLDSPAALPIRLHPGVSVQTRELEMIHELDRHNQWLLGEGPYVRAEFMKRLDTSNLDRYAATSAPYRSLFYDEVIGRFDLPLSPMHPRSRKSHDTPKWTGYEVVLDVFPDVFAYGILLLPKDIKPGEKRPVVVCQHGLEGRPQETIEGNNPAYHDFAAKLAERGFITFAPQNPYIFRDRFRTLQRKANPLGKTLFSLIIPQHQQIINWLKTQPCVDEKRIGFYGLSYGGKTAMRAPAVVTDYCLSICSADFNDWVWKNASTRSPYSYAWMGEYEIFEFNLGSTFNYSEMAALIAPRPFMVERGHFDGVAPDEAVAYEYAKVRHLYAARLKLPERTSIEWFAGPHTINGQGTFEFLHKHLQWPSPSVNLALPDK